MKNKYKNIILEKIANCKTVIKLIGEAKGDPNLLRSTKDQQTLIISILKEIIKEAER